MIETQRHEDVADACDRRRSIADQLVRAGRGAVVDRTGHRHDLDATFEGLSRRGQRSAPLPALDDDAELAERRDDAVAQREPESFGLGGRWPLGYQQSARRDLMPELTVLPWVR